MFPCLRVRGEVPPNAVSYIHVTFLWMGMQEGWVLVPDSVSLLLWSQLLQDSNQTDQCFLSKLCLWRMFRMGIDPLKSTLFQGRRVVPASQWYSF